MGGSLILHTWMLNLDQVELRANEQTWKVSENCKITHFMKHLERIIDYQHQHSFLLHISKLFSL